MIAILHEGNAQKTADNKLIKLLIENLNLDETKVRFFGSGSKSNFFKKETRAYQELLIDIQEEIISRVLFIVDADYKENDAIYGGFDNTLEKLIALRKELDIYDTSDLYISCDFDSKEGYLESLILSSISQEQKECIETFLDCSEFKSKENDKAILNQIYKNAYPNAPYDFSSDKFDILKQKLNKLFEGIA